MALRKISGLEYAYNTETGQLHMVRVVGVDGTETLEDQGAVNMAVSGGGDSLTVPVNAAKGGTRELIAAPGAGNQIWVYRCIAVAGADGTVQFLSAATPLTGVMALAERGGFADGGDFMPLWKCGTNEALNVVLGLEPDLDGCLVYRIVAV